MAAVAQQYGDRASFRAITLTPATFMSPEWYLPETREDRQNWWKQDGFPANLERACEGIDRFGELFPQQVLVLEASSYPVGLRDLGDRVVDYAAMHFAGRVAVQINQLTGRYDQLGRPTIDKLRQYRTKYRSNIIVGLQNLKGWGFPKAREGQGSMEMTAYNSLQAGGEYWELWHHDGASRLVCMELERFRQEGLRLGLPEFKAKLMNEGKCKPWLQAGTPRRVDRAACFVPRKSRMRTPNTAS